VRFVRFIGVALLSLVAALALVDAGVRAAFPSLPRLEDNFSAAYLTRVIERGGVTNHVVFLGDSVLWGYRLPASETATERLARRGVAVTNLSFEGGSMVNTYAMLRVMSARGAAPRAVVFNVNVKEFNAADSAYRTLYPAVETLAWDVLTPQERGLLKQTRPQSSDAAVDRGLSRWWGLYGMRAEMRELLFGAPDAATAIRGVLGDASGRNARTEAAHRPTAERFLGTYDLAPLAGDNVEVVFLRKTVALLAAAGIPAVAILTPANHALLHDYIDVPDYDAQLRYIRAALGPRVRVLDYDRAFASAEFIDNDHLTAAGNARLADMLYPVLPR
jgi:hypothetical protein